jgi:hypothetical protein
MKKTCKFLEKYNISFLFFDYYKRAWCPPLYLEIIIFIELALWIYLLQKKL